MRLSRVVYLYALGSTPYPSPVVAVTPRDISPTCRYLPGDSQWPSDEQWSRLNSTVGGRLIRGVPMAQPCYGPNSDPTTCAQIQDNWSNKTIISENPFTPMSVYWQNNTCSPFGADTNGTCEMGNLASYAINVSDASTVAAGILFAKENNIRLTIKNTGHDFLGRSVGTGSLGLWTHNLKEITFYNYSSPAYNGPAVKAGSGALGSELYHAAREHGLRVTGGHCPTVGLSGGWISGGGHGPLASAYGLGADNTLEFEVVTADGQHVTATSTNEYSDLFWALSGGGVGNFAVALSVTFKAHADGPVAGATFSFPNTHSDGFYSAVAAWMRNQLNIFDKIPGFKTISLITNSAFTLQSVAWPGATEAELIGALTPFYEDLKALDVQLTTNETIVSPTFEDHYNYFTKDLAMNTTCGNRLIPRSFVERNATELVDQIRTMMSENEHMLVTLLGVNVTHARVGNEAGSNAVLPAWRDTLFNMNFGIGTPEDASWDLLRSNQAKTNQFQSRMRELTPTSGSYLNEAVYDDVNWKSDYYGANYEKLLAIKKKYDPDNVFWASVAVGSDAYSSQDGRLCRNE
ncbi:hypothetical protein F5Y04DRAFT_288775 [Hypomontagnella monticulosa]|nr:hypothetical protein F5Y04DRAFT_288775 [Hypomontagnella monticulosa]